MLFLIRHSAPALSVTIWGSMCSDPCNLHQHVQHNRKSIPLLHLLAFQGASTPTIHTILWVAQYTIHEPLIKDSSCLDFHCICILFIIMFILVLALILTARFDMLVISRLEYRVRLKCRPIVVPFLLVEKEKYTY